MDKTCRTVLKKGFLSVSTLDNNFIEKITYKDIQINSFRGNHLFGGVANIYLRFRDQDDVISILEKATHFDHGENYRLIKGEYKNVRFRLLLYLANEHLWFYDLILEGHQSNLDVVYLQDIALDHPNGVLSNELYLSQYLDHKIFKINESFHICSRQNMGSSNPLLAQGSINIKTKYFATDAMQWFGPSFKVNKKPILLNKDLPNVNYQYELATPSLQTEKFNLDGKRQFSFYAFLKEEQELPIEKLDFLPLIESEYQKIPQHLFDRALKEKTNQIAENISLLPIICRDLTENELNEYFPKREFSEKQDGQLLSFFTNDYSHVVLQNKEKIQERPSGNIITTQNGFDDLDLDLFTSTNYSYGLFNAQVVSGNTSMHKFLSINRGLLNINQITGQRVFIKINKKYQMLGVPSAYKMGLNYSLWYYALKDDVIKVKVFMSSKKNKINFLISSKLEKPYDFLITNQIVMGEHEYVNPYKMRVYEKSIVFKLADNTFQKTKYPNLTYKIHLLNHKFYVSGDEIFYTDQKRRDSSLVIIKISDVSKVEMTLLGTSGSKKINSISIANFKIEKKRYLNYYKQLLSGFNLKHPNNLISEKLNIATYWFAHNAMVHYAVPHGLEQSGGAAWGTRDVCQGPFEFFLATNNYPLARDILLRVFSHQLKSTGEWPQWFFLDDYRFAADSCHGDIIFWPLKALGDYLKVTNDKNILFETVSYFDNRIKSSIFEHIGVALSTIEKRFIAPYDLISFAGGDWNDTLQPANKEMEKSLVSTWTQALAFHSCFNLLGSLEGIKNEIVTKLDILCSRINNAFEKYCLLEGPLPGFIKIENDDSFQYLLHPQDNKTGIKYRLLPLTRSILANLVSNEKANYFSNIIDQHLAFPDGVRLMDNPPKYSGGKMQYFVRAEQASNVGRELSLLYVHAHLRYIQAMGKIGQNEKAYNSLLKVIPLGLSDVVSNTLPRQSNAYFSSSDGMFNDRYDFQNNFSNLRKGLINVRGGWRIYSSGPGLFIKILINNFIGLKVENDYLIINPSLPKIFDKLTVKFKINEKNSVFVFHVKNPEYTRIQAKIRNKHLKSETFQTKYCKSLIKIHLSQIINTNSKIDIYLL